MAGTPSPEPARDRARLYLMLPVTWTPEALAAALGASDAACALLLSQDVDEEALRQAIARLRPVAQELDVAFLLQDHAELAAATGCDGAHLSALDGYGVARVALGDDAIVGVGCGNSRHDAMVAAERGADYIAFGGPGPDGSAADAEILSWWQRLMTVPCVAFGARGPEDCARLADAGADFVAVSAALWQAPEGAATVLDASAEAVASAVPTA